MVTTPNPSLSQQLGKLPPTEGPLHRSGPTRTVPTPTVPTPTGRSIPPFNQVYREHFPFVFRNARRLGVLPASLDDVVQDVFVVVLRRLPEFSLGPDGGTLRGWVYTILANTVRDHRRATWKRNSSLVPPPESSGALPDAETARSPEEQLGHAEDVELLIALLTEMDDDKREVLVLAELEQMTIPEIAIMTSTNENTLYSRLRVAREELRGRLARALNGAVKAPVSKEST